MADTALKWAKLWCKAEGANQLSLFSISTCSSLLIRLILIYCFNYTFLPWPLFLHVSLETVVWSVKWKEAKPSVFVIPDLYDVVNPFQTRNIQSRFPLEFANILSERKRLSEGFLVISWPGQCLLSWSLFGRWPPLCCQRLMLSMPLPWQISL